jgi:hypothetical protein
VDEHNIYGGDEGMMKSAVNEIRANMYLLDCRIQGLHFPLMVLINYRGRSLLASTRIPVGSDSLVYGSSNGGETILASDPQMNAIVEKLANMLNLKGSF